MRIAETCSCGARIECDGDDQDQIRKDVQTWRVRHKCGGHDPWVRSVHSTTDSVINFGFQQREDTVMARG